MNDYHFESIKQDRLQRKVQYFASEFAVAVEGEQRARKNCNKERKWAVDKACNTYTASFETCQDGVNPNI